MGAQPVDKLQIMDWQNGVNCPPLDSTVWQINRNDSGAAVCVITYSFLTKAYLLMVSITSLKRIFEVRV